MLTNTFILIVALFLVVKGATLATKYAGRLAESFNLSKYAIGFIVIAVISILPEAFIAINSAIQGVPAFGLGTLFGSNIADLTLVFAVIVLYVGRGLKVESKILKNQKTFPFLLLFPLVLGLDGHYSRTEGLALIVAGAVFYYLALKNGASAHVVTPNGYTRRGSLLLLLISMGILLAGAHFTVASATALAYQIGIKPVLIGMLVVGLGTTMPEFFFSLKSVQKHDDALAIGDILGTVLADATIVVGVLALIQPFSFPQKIIYITGAFMVVASFILFRFLKSGHTLTKKEARLLIVFWAAFVFIEFFANA